MAAWKLCEGLSGLQGVLSTKKNVAIYFSRYHTRSLGIAKTDLQIWRRIIQRILQKLIHTFPYTLNLAQRLESVIYKAQMDYACWCSQTLETGSSFAHRISFSDKCVFHVSGELNEHSV